MTIALLTGRELDGMRAAGKLAAQLLNHLGTMVVPGITTQEIDDEAERWTQERGARSGPLGYKGYAKSICTSINQVICHGIPEARALQEGDIVNIDVSPVLNGYFGDTSRTFAVGQISEKAKRLVKTTEECLDLAIKTVRPGSYVGDIGAAIQTHAESRGYSVVRDFAGHGVNRIFHTDPIIFHYGQAGTGLQLRAGMVFTIEPMINEGRWEMRVLGDQWTAVTIDGRLSAQCEHTVAVVPDGVEILTKV